MNAQPSNIALTQVCLSCRGQNPEVARYCMHCGQSLEVSQPASPEAAARGAGLRGENRVVTVMFVDIVGSTALARALGAEAWHSLLGEFFAQAAAVVEGAGGSINQYTGDGFMALFGAPAALEDHALQAALAALQLRERMRGLASEVRDGYSQNWALRTGLNSGPVVVGAIADDWRRDYTAQGDTVHLAARMEQLAAPNGILLAERTAALLRGRLPLRAGDALQPKGMDGVIRSFELHEDAVEPASASSVDAAAQQAAPLIGRHDVLEQVRRQQQRLRQNSKHAAILWLDGEAGLGKSRIGKELWREWQELPQRPWLRLRCAAVSQADARPLAPIRHMLLSWLGVDTRSVTDSARQVVAATIALEYPQLAEMLPLLLDFLGLSDDPAADDGREQKLAQLPHHLCQALTGRKLLLWVDDWHALDADSRHFLQHWLMELKDCGGGVALVGSRPGHRPDWLVGEGFHVQTLAALPVAHMRSLLAALVAPWANYSAYGRTLLAKAEGNPLFLCEAVAHAVQQGRMRGPMGRRVWCSGVQDWELPDSVQALLASRLESAGRWAAELLSMAALIGRDFSEAWLAIVAEHSEQDLQQPLRDLAIAGLLQARQPGYWRFSQALLREVAAQRLLQGQRNQYLQRLAAALQEQLKQGSLDEAVWAQVAGFWAAAQCWESAVEASLAAGNYWMRQRLSEGLRWYRQALQWTHQLSASNRQGDLEQSALFALLQSTSLGGAETTSIQQWMQRAQHLTEVQNMPLRAAELHIIRSTHLLNAGATRQAYRLIRQAAEVALSHAEGGQELIARFRVPILFAHFLRGDIRGGLNLFDQQDDGAWRAGEPHADNYLSRGFYALLMAAAGKPREAISELERVHQFASEQMTPVSWIAGNLVELYIQSGQHDRHPDLATEAMNIAQDFGSPLFLAVALRAQSLSLLALNRAHDAWELLAQHASLLRQSGPAQVYAAAMFDARAQVAFAVGAEDEAQESLQQAWASARRRGELYWQAKVMMTRLRLATQPDPKLYRRALRLIRRTGAIQLDPEQSKPAAIEQTPLDSEPSASRSQSLAST